jgi:hypothetical protein
VTVRDSAGIRIVENRVQNGAVPVYAELGEPDLEIGVVDGDPAYAFESIVGVASLPGRALVVAEGGGARQLRIFDAAGAHLRSIGREGRGPGEFVALTNLAVVSGDTIWAWDSRTRRMTAFRSDGTFAATATLASGVCCTRRVSRFSDGSFLDYRQAPLPLGGFGIQRLGVEAWRFDAQGSPTDSLLTLPGPEAFLERNPQGGIMVAPVPMGRSVSHGATKWQVVVAASDAYRLVHRSATGNPTMIVTAPDLERPFAPGEVEELLEKSIADCSSALCPGITERMFEAYEVPETRPAFSELIFDALDHLWVAEWEPDGTPVTGWHVFSSDGELLGRVAVPPGLEVHEIRADYVLGVVTNELDVPFVRRYPLTRLR